MLQAPPITFGTARIVAQPSASSGPERLLLAPFGSPPFGVRGPLTAPKRSRRRQGARTESCQLRTRALDQALTLPA